MINFLEWITVKKKSSDIDLVIVFKKEIHFKDFLLPKAEFVNSEIIPYGVDLINLEKVDNLELKKHITEFGKEFEF